MQEEEQAWVSEFCTDYSVGCLRVLGREAVERGEGRPSNSEGQESSRLKLKSASMKTVQKWWLRREWT